MSAAADRRAWGGVALAVAACVAGAWPTRLSMVDDAYVSMRYAMNLALGYGLTYSAGEPPTEGYTNFLWVLLLAPATRLPVHPATWATGLGLAFGALAVLLAGAVGRALAPGSRLAPVAAAFALGAVPHFAVAITNGLETALFVATLLGASLAALRAHPLAGPVAGLLYLVRPEGGPVGLVLAAWAAVRRRSVRPLLGHAAVVVPYFAGRAAWFGTLVPNTWNAQARGTIAEMWAMNEDYFRAGAPVFAGMAGLAVLGLLPGPSRGARALLVGLALALGAVSLQVYNWMPGLRLWLPSLALLAAAAAPAVTLPRAGPTVGVVLLAWLGWLQLDPARVARRYDGAHTVLPGNGGEVLGRRIAAAAPANSWLLVRDAGVTAYFAGPAVKVIDIHPWSLTDPRLTGKPFDFDYLLDRDVAFLVTTGKEPGQVTDYGVERRLLRDPRVRDRFVSFGEFHQHRRRYYTGWVRRDLANRVESADTEAP